MGLNEVNQGLVRKGEVRCGVYCDSSPLNASLAFLPNVSIWNSFDETYFRNRGHSDNI